MLANTRLLATLFALFSLLSLTTAEFADDCDARSGAHCVHGPSPKDMRVGREVIFNLHAGEILAEGPGHDEGNAYVLSENSAGTAEFQCLFGAPRTSRFNFTLGPSYSYVVITGPKGDKGIAWFKGSATDVSYHRYDQASDVTHTPGVDLMFRCTGEGR